MIRSIKVMALIAVIAMLTVPLFAQTSPTGRATAGIFETDVEDSMNVLWYSDVEFERWAGFLGYGGSVQDNPISLGYATGLGPIYLGTWYTGNILSTNSSEEERVVTSYDLINQVKTQTVITRTYQGQNTFSNNSIEVLIGVAGMGIKFGFEERYTVWENPDRIITTIETPDGRTTYQNEVDEFSTVQGHMIPSLQWGMNIDAGNLAIRPKISVGLGIYHDYEVMNTIPNYTIDNAAHMGNEQINRQGYSANYLNPYFDIGVELGIPTAKENSKGTLGISYGFSTNVYNNSLEDTINNAYSFSGFDGSTRGTTGFYSGSTTVIKTLQSTTTTNTINMMDITEISQSSHSITPSFYYTNEIAENLKLGFLVLVPFGIEKNSSEGFSRYFSTSIEKYNHATNHYLNTTTNIERFSSTGLTETSEFSVGLGISAGATYILVPGRFTINAGVNLTPVNYTRTTTTFKRGSTHETQTTTILDADGKVVSDTIILTGNPGADTTTDSTYVQNEWNPLAILVGGGFRFNFTDGMAIDMVASGGNMSPFFNLNFANVHVLFTLKF